MNGMDVALVVLLLICAIRGFWRGFFREGFGLLALVVGLGAALRFAAPAASMLSAHLDLPLTARLGIAFVGIYILSYTVLNLLGLLFDRLIARTALRGVNKIGGAAFGLGKGGAILAFVLLFFHLFPVVPGLDQQIMGSRIARPMVSAAGLVLRHGWRETAPTESQA